MSGDDKVSPHEENATVPRKEMLLSRMKLLTQNPIVRILLRIGRVGIYLFGIWTSYFYFWNILGILIGVTLVVFPRAEIWRQHGLVLAYTAAIFGWAFTVGGYIPGTIVWILLAGLIQVVYLVSYTIFYSVKYLILGFRKLTKREKETVVKESWFRRVFLDRIQIGALTRRPKLTLRLKTTAVLVILLAPLLIWSSVSIDFEVMFENSPVLLWVHAPSTVDTGTQFEVNIEAWDQFERPSSNYLGTVEFSIQSYNQTTGLVLTGVDAILPDAYSFTGGLFSPGLEFYSSEQIVDYGICSFDARINTPGIHYILVQDSHTQNTYWSNPIIVDDFAVDAPRIYWGDVHAHSSVSDGSGTPTESYLYGRYLAHLDFMALTDHGEDFTLLDRAKTGTAEFQDYLLATENAYAPGEFVSFYGAEWTSPGLDQTLWFVPIPENDGKGHYTCIFSGNTMPIFSSITETTTGDLWNLLDDFTSSTGARALAIPHHTVRSLFIQDWTLMNPNYVKLVEVTSVHGECLYDNELNYRGSVDLPETPIPGSSVIDALNMGYRMTFMANGDNHDGRPGHSISHTRASIGHQYPYSLYNARHGHPYPSGITAVYTTGLTRNEVFTGLENGRIYGISDYGRPIIDFSINGVSVGYNATVSVASSTTARNLSLFIAQDGSPAAGMNQAATAGASWIPNWGATVEIIKNGVIWQSITLTSPAAFIAISDTEAITGTSYDQCIESEDGEYYINERSENPTDPSSLNTGGMDYYSIRIVGDNGRTMYIGPIWVSSP